MNDGRLKRSDPWLAAMQWKGWCCSISSIGDSRRDEDDDPREIEAAAKSAADAFLKIYGPDDPAPKAKRRS